MNKNTDNRSYIEVSQVVEWESGPMRHDCVMLAYSVYIVGCLEFGLFGELLNPF